MDRDEQLMAVLLGQPSPSGDAAAASAYAEAERDMDVVRHQLQRVGNGLARHASGGQDASGNRDSSPDGRAGSAEASARGVRTSRTRGLLFALAASVAVAALGTGTAYWAAHNGGTEEHSADTKLTPEGIVACSTAVAEGTVARVDPLARDQGVRVVLDADRYYKPRSGKPELVFTSEGDDTGSYYRPGVRMLVIVSRFSAEGPQTFRQGDPVPDGHQGSGIRDALDWGRQWVDRALPGAAGMPCPAG
ncbi:hypothetical protein QNO09_18720 [Streptomyces sp. 378]|uniref:hypothetical protein n=1 Tax=Streptomyces sp. 378 TaxID=3049412 RepID=UPI0024C2AFF2|nr:hypothetical protein [Streptomyces sp. 378]MDK1345296.1 hypothetical protein [Streptomyces sp. 378]